MPPPPPPPPPLTCTDVVAVDDPDDALVATTVNAVVCVINAPLALPAVEVPPVNVTVGEADQL